MNDLQIQRAAELLQNEFGPEWQTIAGMFLFFRGDIGKQLDQQFLVIHSFCRPLHPVGEKRVNGQVFLL